MNTTKWAVISRLVREKNLAKREELLNSENEKAKQACVVGSPFEVEHVSHVDFNPETHDMTVNGVPNEWATALLSRKQGSESSEDELADLLEEEKNNKNNTNNTTDNDNNNSNNHHSPNPKELPNHLSHLNIKWDPVTGDFENLPEEWQDLLEDAHELNEEVESATMKKRLLEDQLTKKDEEEKERRRGVRGALPIDSSILLRAIETPPSSPPLHLSSNNLHNYSSSASSTSSTSSTSLSSFHSPSSSPLLGGRVRSHSASSFLNPPRSLNSSSEITNDVSKDKPTTYYFTDAGHELGVETWRLEGKVPIPIPFSTLMDGKLRTGDCYIFLHTCEDDEGGDGDGPGPIKHDLYYWLGTNAPVDLKTLAAFRSVELKSILGKRRPVYMHRLEQGEETPEFEAIFSQPIQYLEGGTVSGLINITEQYTNRLYQIRGHFLFRIRRVEPSYTSLNHFDVFIFDIGTRIFIWCGKKASAQKQVRSCEIATKLKYETMKCRGTVEILDSDDKDAEFWNPLGGFHDVPLTSTPPSSDAQIKEEEEKTTTLYRVKDSGEIVKVEELPLVAGLLDSNFCFILDCETEVYIWSGKSAGNLKQSVAIILAQEFKNVFSDRPSWVSITSIFEGEEPVCFKDRFLFWEEKVGSPKPALRPRAQSGAQKGKEFDVMKMMITPATPAPANTIPTSPSTSSIPSLSPASSPGVSPTASFQPTSIPMASPEDSEAPPPEKPAKAWEGLKKVEHQYEKALYGWKSTANGWEEMEEEDFGQFYSNRCYVYHVIFTPEIGKSHSQVYFWQGSIAANRFWISFKFEIFPAIEERMRQMDGITPSTVQLQQHKEVPAFLDLFDGKIIYHESSRGFNVRLYQVRTDNTGRLRASQCLTADINHLNSGDSFIFWNFVRTSFFVWHGKGSPASTRSFSIDVVNSLKSSCLPSSHNQTLYLTKEVDEGKETYEFWQHSGLSTGTSASTSATNLANITSTNVIVGVETKYASESWLRDPARKPPRLFVCHEDLFSGQFTVTYSPYICQSLMSHNDVLIVDVFHAVFVWSGLRASAYKKEMGLKTAALYIAKSTLGHAADTPLVSINETQETLGFKSLFLSWRAKAADYVDPFASRPITPKTSSGREGAGKDSFAINSILKRRHMFGGRDDDDDDEIPQPPPQQTSSPSSSPAKSKLPKSSTPSSISPTPSTIPTSPSKSPSSRRLANLKPPAVDVLDLETSSSSSLSPSPLSAGMSPKMSKAPKTPKQKSPSSPNNTFKKIGNADVLEITHSDSETGSESENEDYAPLVKSVSENDVVSPNSHSQPTRSGVIVEGASYSVASIVSNFDHLLSSKEIEARNSKLRGIKRSPSMGFDDLSTAVRKSPSMENVDTRSGRPRSGSGGGSNPPTGNFAEKVAPMEPIEEVDSQTNSQEPQHEETLEINNEENENNENEEAHEEVEEVEEVEVEEQEAEEIEPTENGTEENDTEVGEGNEDEIEQEQEEEHTEHEEVSEEQEGHEEHEENGQEETEVAEHEENEGHEEDHEEHDLEEHEEHEGHEEDHEGHEVHEEAEESTENGIETAEHDENGEEKTEEHEQETEETETYTVDQEGGDEGEEKEAKADNEETEETEEGKEEEEKEEEPEKPKPKPPTAKTTTKTPATKTTLKKPATSKAPAKPSATTSKSKPAAPTAKATAKAPAKPAAPKATAKTPAKPGAKPAAAKTTTSTKPPAKPATSKLAAGKPPAITTKTLAPKKPAASPKSPTAASSVAKSAPLGARKPAATTATRSTSPTKKPAAKPAATKTTTAKPAAPSAKKEPAKTTTVKPAAPAAKKVAAKAPAKTTTTAKPAPSTAKTTKTTTDTKKATTTKGKPKTNAA